MITPSFSVVIHPNLPTHTKKTAGVTIMQNGSNAWGPMRLSVFLPPCLPPSLSPPPSLPLALSPSLHPTPHTLHPRAGRDHDGADTDEDQEVVRPGLVACQEEASVYLRFQEAYMKRGNPCTKTIRRMHAVWRKFFQPFSSRCTPNSGLR